MKIKALAEAIILQSFEDLWDNAHRSESLEFFNGDGFDYYSELAGLGTREKMELLSMFGKQMELTGLVAAEKKETFSGEPK